MSPANQHWPRDQDLLDFVKWARNLSNQDRPNQGAPVSQTQTIDQLTENFSATLMELIQKDLSVALSVLTGHFVGLTIAVLTQEGYDPDTDITINGGDARDITIHAPKDKNESADNSGTDQL